MSDPPQTKIIQSWSGPRNVSTALMYSFRQRADTTVVDEPLYAHYLRRSGRQHPMGDQVIASQSIDPNTVVREVIQSTSDRPVRYVKQMAHHFRGVGPSVLAGSQHVLLIRDPAAVLSSLSIQLPDCTLADTGLVDQIDILNAVDLTSGDVVVIDSADLLADPAGVLTALCDRLGLAFDPAMLAWPAGPKPEDGVWAPAWYHRVHQSTGFAAPSSTTPSLPVSLRPVWEQAMPLYDQLWAQRLDSPGR